MKRIYNGDFQEAYQCGCIGLVKASKLFDPSRGLKFSTLAIPLIRNAILKDVRERDKGKNKYQTFSLNEPISSDEGVPREYLDTMESTEWGYEDIDSSTSYKNIYRRIQAWLTDEEKKILETRRKYPNKSQTELGELLGLSQAQVSRKLKEIKSVVLKIINE